MQNETHYIQKDTIDLRKLFSMFKKRKKLIWSITTLFTLLAVIYALVATTWWQANATIEIGKYIEQNTGKEVYLENGSAVSERLHVQHIDVYAHVKDRDSAIKSIHASKKNPQFISITALGKENKLAEAEIKKVIDDLQNKHQKIIDEIIAKKQSLIDQLDRDIFVINHHKIPKVSESIDYIKKVQLTSIEKKIASVESNLKISIIQKDEAMKNLTSLNDEASLSALRMAQIQGLEYKIYGNEIKLIDLNREKQKIISTDLPNLTREIEKLTKIDLVLLKEKRELTILSMQPHNYENTKIVSKIITQDKPIKPMKKLIIIVAFITGLILSVFLAFFLEFIRGMEENETQV